MMKFIVALCLVFGTQSFASDAIKVLGLFSGKAYLTIAGTNKLLLEGESYQGITLIQATGRWAKIKDKDGTIYKISPNASISGSYKAPNLQSVKIYPNKKGMYQVNGHINNTPVAFLVDTGASYVAMSERHAQKIGLPYKQKGRRSSAQTANGIALTWELTLDSVNVGGLKVNYVPAAVISGDHPYQVLLGMSYLKNLKVEHSGNAMVLQKKYE